MGRLFHDSIEQFKEVAWALFLINLFILVFFLLFGKYAGYETMAWICLGTSLLVFTIFGCIYAINLAVILGWRIFTRFSGKWERTAKTDKIGDTGEKSSCNK